MAALGSFTRAGGPTDDIVNLTGTLNNTGLTQTFNSTIGSWNLDNGTLNGGTLNAAAGYALVSEGGTLIGVTIDGSAGNASPLDMQTNTSSVTVSGALLLSNSTIHLGNSTGSTYGRLFFGDSSPQLLDGADATHTGTIVFGPNGNNLIDGNGGSTSYLTLGANLTVQGLDGTITANNSMDVKAAVTVDPTLFVGQTSGTITFSGNNWKNDATLTGKNGGSLSLQGTSWANNGTVTVQNGGNLTLNGSSSATALGWTNTGAISISGGGTLTLQSSGTAMTADNSGWSNTGTISATGATTTVNLGGIFTLATLGNFSRTGGPTDDIVNLTGTLNNTMPATINLATGLDASNNLISTNGTADNNWTVDEPAGGTGAAEAVTAAGADWYGGWVADGPNSDWIARNANVSNNGPAPYTFYRTFDLTGYNLADVSIAGAWTVDDGGTLYLNGHAIASLNSGSWGSLNDFAIPAGSPFLNAGLNTLSITITQSDENFEGVNLEGSVNTSTTLALNASTGSWILAGGTIKGGTVEAAAGYSLISQGGNLSNVTLAYAGTGGNPSPLDMQTNSSTVTVSGSLLLSNATLHLGNANANSSTDGRLYFSDTTPQTLDADRNETGTIVFGINGSNGIFQNGGGYLTIGQNLTLNGTEGAISAPYGGMDFKAALTVNPTFTGSNGGTISLSGNNWKNDGTLTAENGGTVQATGTFTNFSGGTLTGGTWQAINGGTLDLVGANITTLAANILVDGSGSQVLSNNGGTNVNALAGLATVAAAGSLTIQNGNNLTTAGNLGNAGSVTIGPSSTLKVSGNYSQTAGGNLNINVGGHSNTGAFGTLNITGAPTLAGNLNIGLVGGFLPATTDSYPIMSFAAGARSTDFSNKNGLTFSGGLFVPQYANNGLTLSVAADQAPAITSANNTTLTSGSAGSFTVTTTGSPAPSLSESGSLPTGVTFTDNGNGTAGLAGTPGSETSGTYAITITAGSSAGSTTQSFTLTIDQTPAITSANSTTFTIGTAGSFTVTATGSPAPTITESGALPSGVSFTSATGVLSGTPASGTAGSYPLVFTAANGVGSAATQNFTLTVSQSAPGALVFTTAPQTFIAGQASGLITVLLEDGHGNVVQAGSAGLTLSLSTTSSQGAFLNSGGNPLASPSITIGPGFSTASFEYTDGSVGTPTVTVAATGFSVTQQETVTPSTLPPTITSGSTATFAVGQSGTFVVQATGLPLPALIEQGTLPQGVTFTDNGNGTATLTGTPATGTGSVYAFTITAANSTGTAAQSFTLTVDQPLAFTSTSGTQFFVGEIGSFTVQTSGFPLAVLTESGALPGGVTFTDNGDGSAGLDGTPAAGTVGTYPITISASNSAGSSTSQSFTLTVAQPLGFTSPNSTTFVIGSPGSFPVTTNIVPTPTLSETGNLPAGVTFGSTVSGAGPRYSISGTPSLLDTPGDYHVTFTATSGLRVFTQDFTLILDQAPAFSSASSATFTVAANGSFSVQSAGFPAPSLTETGALPSGVTFTAGNGTATLSGTPAEGADGTYPITFTATNSVSSVSPSFTLTVNQAPVATFAFAGLGGTEVAGSSDTFTITAQDAAGYTLTAYQGTVHFTSTDPKAAPGDYTFTAGDHGTHSFTTTLRTAGNESITATDMSDGASSSATYVVTPLAPNSLSMTGLPTSIGTGQNQAIVVSALDIYNNIATSYTGTLQFTSSDTAASLPANTTLTAGDGGTRTFTVAFATAGSQTLTVADTVNSGLTVQQTVSVIATPAGIEVTGLPTTVTAGKSANVTVIAVDSSGNPLPAYRGTIQFQSTDLKAVLPANYTFSAADDGHHTFPVTFDTAGTQSVTATDTANASLSGSEFGIAVSPAAAATLQLTGLPSSATTGESFPFTVTAYDTYGNLATGYTGTVKFATGDTKGTVPANYTFKTSDAGTHTFSATLVTVGSQSVSVTDKANSALTAAGSVSVNAVTASQFQVTAPGGTTAGTPIQITVTATDANGNTATGYSGTVDLSSTDPNLVRPNDYTFQASDKGVHTFSVTLNTAGSQTVTATDTTSGITGTSSAVTVAAGTKVTQFVVVGSPTPLAPSVPTTVIVMAEDASGNIVTGYTGTVHLTSSDTQATLPANYKFTTADKGVHTLPITLVAAGTDTVTATDAAQSSVKGSAQLTVDPTAATQLSLSTGLTQTTAGTQFNVTVTAQNNAGTTVTGYVGTVHFSSTDSAALLPADYTFTTGDQGTHTFPLTLMTAGTQSITVMDKFTSTLTASQTGITVGAGATTATLFSVESLAGATPTAAGTAVSITVQALAAYGQLAIGYTGTIQLTSTDPNAVLPANYTFTAADQGQHTFSVTFKTAGSPSITATDVNNPLLTDTQQNIPIVAGSVAQLAIAPSATAPIVAGTPGTISVTAEDAYGNTVTGYTGTVQFTDEDVRTVLPANYTFVSTDQGTHNFPVTCNTVTTESIGVADTTHSSITGTASIAVQPASFRVSATNHERCGQFLPGHRHRARRHEQPGRRLFGDHPLHLDRSAGEPPRGLYVHQHRQRRTHLHGHPQRRGPAIGHGHRRPGRHGHRQCLRQRQPRRQCAGALGPRARRPPAGARAAAEPREPGGPRPTRHHDPHPQQEPQPADRPGHRRHQQPVQSLQHRADLLQLGRPIDRRGTGAAPGPLRAGRARQLRDRQPAVWPGQCHGNREHAGAAVRPVDRLTGHADGAALVGHGHRQPADQRGCIGDRQRDRRRDRRHFLWRQSRRQPPDAERHLLGREQFWC